VPTTCPLCVCPLSSSSFLASPKSVTFGVPSAAKSTLAGLRSRWTMFRSWAYCTARASVSVTSAAYRGGCGSRAIFLASGPPSTNSSEKYGIPSNEPTSKIWTMLGCWNRATARASASNRVTAAALACGPARIILRATTRSRAVCRAFQTTPMPPRPSSPSIT
jgi:hypothetical protein